MKALTYRVYPLYVDLGKQDHVTDAVNFCVMEVDGWLVSCSRTRIELQLVDSVYPTTLDHPIPSVQESRFDWLGWRSMARCRIIHSCPGIYRYRRCSRRAAARRPGAHIQWTAAQGGVAVSGVEAGSQWRISRPRSPLGPPQGRWPAPPGDSSATTLVPVTRAHGVDDPPTCLVGMYSVPARGARLPLVSH